MIIERFKKTIKKIKINNNKVEIKFENKDKMSINKDGELKFTKVAKNN